MKKRVLVFPCGSEIGLEIYNSVNNSLYFELIGLSSIPDHGGFVYENYIEGIGYFTEPNFIDKLKDIIKKNKIDILYPTMDSVITMLKKHEQNLGITIVGSSYNTAVLCESKRDTYKILKEHIRVPELYNKKSWNLIFPMFLKPNIGYGSRNIKKIDSSEQLININLEENVLCEYLPGKEFTIDCFTNLKGKLIFVGARERSRVVNGISVNTKSNRELSNEFKKIAKKINTIVPFVGSWFFQMKNDLHGNPCLLEIACRFAGSSSVHRIKGMNFALSNLYLAIGIEQELIINDFEVEMDRALDNVYKINIVYDSVFIDYDDTIICNNKVNLDAVKFIFNARNRNIKINLITKHKGDLLKSLKYYRIENLFDEIFHLKKEEKKVSYLIKNNYKNSIFIDDSFSERKEINNALGIPVFSIDAISSLV
jgi:predicted ATP-grasp superfamily ATP-dependent carboligase